MSIISSVQKIQLIYETNPSKAKFLLMFVGSAICFGILLMTNGRSAIPFWQSGLTWVLLSISFVLVVSLFLGLVMFRSKSQVGDPPSINSKAD